jgi:tight adherence protein B
VAKDGWDARDGQGSKDGEFAAGGLEALAEAVEQISALAKAGLTGPELWRPLLGRPAEADDLIAWARQLEGTPAGPYASAVVAIHRIATRAGASTATLLGCVTGALAEAQETTDSLTAAMAGPKSSARLLQFLPLLGIVLGSAMGAEPLRVLFGGGAGTVALVAGLGLLIAGRAWTGALISAAARPPSTDPLAAAVLAAALRAGLVLPTALTEVGMAWPGGLGGALEAVGRALAAGQSWDEAWAAAGVRAGRQPRSGLANGSPANGPPAAGAASGRRPAVTAFLENLRRALAPVWQSGAEAGPLLEGVSQRAARAERRRGGQAAGRLGVHLMAPLGLCFLPAFIALGLVPVVLSFAGELLPGL